MTGEMAQKGDLSKSSFCKLDLVEDTRNKFDCNRLAGYFVSSRTVESTVEKTANNESGMDVHDMTISARPHLSNEFPSFFHVENLSK